MIIKSLNDISINILYINGRIHSTKKGWIHDPPLHIKPTQKTTTTF